LVSFFIFAPWFVVALIIGGRRGARPRDRNHDAVPTGVFSRLKTTRNWWLEFKNNLWNCVVYSIYSPHSNLCWRFFMPLRTPKKVLKPDPEPVSGEFYNISEKNATKM
jgi:hypothetical protein